MIKDSITTLWSDNGKREATVYISGEKVGRYYTLEKREKGSIRDLQFFELLNEAEDAAEDWVL